MTDFQRTRELVLERFKGFGCGPGSPLGIELDVHEKEDHPDHLCAEWIPDPREEGPPGTVHGGVQAILADAMAGWCVADHLRRHDTSNVPLPVTARLDLEYDAPLPVDRPVVVTGRVLRHGESRIHVQVQLATQQGVSTHAVVEYHLDNKRSPP